MFQLIDGAASRRATTLAVIVPNRGRSIDASGTVQGQTSEGVCAVVPRAEGMQHSEGLRLSELRRDRSQRTKYRE